MWAPCHHFLLFATENEGPVDHGKARSFSVLINSKFENIFVHYNKISDFIFGLRLFLLKDISKRRRSSLSKVAVSNLLSPVLSVKKMGNAIQVWILFSNLRAL